MVNEILKEEEAIGEAVAYCMDHNIMAEFLAAHGSELITKATGLSAEEIEKL